jgi:hypothetical protein
MDFFKIFFKKKGHIENSTQALNLVTTGPISAFRANMRERLHRTVGRQIQYRYIHV